MSKPVTNVQIEDVLSSIRRLVSEDSRSDTADETSLQAPVPVEAPVQAPVQMRGEAADAAAFDKPDRLVLTPALRVNEASEAEETVADESGAAEAQGAAEEAATGAAVESATPWADPSATLYSVTETEEAAEEPGEAPIEEAVSEAPQEDLISAPEPETEDATPAEPVGEAPDTDGEVEPEETLTFHSARAESLSAKIEALEAVIGQTRDQWEPDGTGGDSYSGTPVHPIGWQEGGDPEAAEADPVPEAPEAVPDISAELVEDLIPEAIDAEDDMAGDQFAEDPSADDLVAEDLAGDEAVLDEDSLRELVAEIVRQELQGALGERITRNVRKLVRREIHRALAAQDLE